MKIMEASAGSGKTYNLAKTYIRILLDDKAGQDKYRHILAVTFTNKATDEMKRRILKELYTLATDPTSSKYYDDFVPDVISTAAALRDKAQNSLRRILHDYGAFAVSTIDRFFQMTLKAFSREIGHFASYQVELDKDSLVDEAVDRILDSLSDSDAGMLEWLTESAMDSLEETGRFSLEKSLAQVAHSLKSERLRIPLEKMGVKVSEMFSRKRLQDVKDACDKEIANYRTSVQKAAKRIEDCLKAAGLTPENFKGTTLKAFANYLTIPLGKEIKSPSEAFLRDAQDSSKWFKKADQHYLKSVAGTLGPAFKDFCDLFGRRWMAFNTALLIRRQLYGLGIARELEEQFSALLTDKNVLSLDDSNTLLKDIIDGSDAPFVYEKLGVRFENFLLDEFQDTSTIQWDNFRPLLTNSESQGFDNLVVGDVKQSIYRFRGSDWRLLKERVPMEFPEHNDEPLEGNHRTLETIVNFNNGLFAHLAKTLGLQDIYQNVNQDVCVEDKAKGSVEVVFKESADEEMDEIVSTIRTLRESGAQYRDIAILVRGNEEGGNVAGRLIGEGIPVVSDDSLKVRSSRIVRLAASALSLIATPPSTDRNGRLKVPVEGFEAYDAGIAIPDSYDSIPALADRIIHGLMAQDPESSAGEVTYVQSFLDFIQDWVSINGNDLPGFLKAWAESDPTVCSPATGDSVRIMTIHKSKGLEFPFVILPFVEKISVFKESPRGDKGYWCAPDVKDTPLEGEVEGLYNVRFTGKLAGTLFAADLAEEKELQKVDNLNIFYVAMTRPRYGLKVIANPNGRRENMAKLLRDYTGGDFVSGELYDFTKMKREKEGEGIEMEWPSWPVADDVDSRLKVSADAADFFGEDGSVGVKASERILGNVCHGILASVKVPSDLEAAVDGAVRRGEIGMEDRDAALAFLRTKIAFAEPWGLFPDSPETIMNEMDILDSDGSVYRPDRIIAADGKAVVVDYKFGERRGKYKFQVGRYMRLLRDMGYTDVTGYLWYVMEDGGESIEKIS